MNKIKRADLVKALKAVLPGAKENPRLPGADSFVLSPGLVQTYNDHLSISYPVQGLNISAAVKVADVVKVLEKMAGMEITLESGPEDASLQISDQRTTLTMKQVETSTAARISALDLDGLDWIPLPSGFLRALKLCLFSTATNPSMGVLTGIRVEDGDIISNDNFRCTWAAISEDMIPFTIPGHAAIALLKVPDKLAEYAVTESWVHFRSPEKAIFSSILLGGEYPIQDIKELFPSEGEHQSYELPESLKASLERTSLMSCSQSGVMDFVSIRREGEDILVEGQRESGNIVDRVEAGENGFPEGVQIYINPNFLMDIMGITRKFNLVENLLLFHGEGFFYLSSTINKE